MSGHLPPGWIWSTLGEVFTVNPPSSASAADDSLVSFVPMPAVGAMTGRLDAGDGKRLADVKKGLTPFIEGDLLFAKITPSMENGKIAVAKGLIGGIGFGSTEFHVARPHAEMASEYLLFFLMQQAVRHEAKSNMTGTAGQRRVPTDYFASLPFPLPPLAEQRRIVEEIEKQFTRLDAAIEALRAAQAKLKRYRASVLNAAVTGRLVPTEAALARTEDRDYEHASTLLERIAKERQAEEERGKPRRKRPKPAPVDTSNLPELPEGWVWSNVSDLIVEPLSNGRSVKKANEGFPVLRLTALRDGEIDQNEYRVGAWTAKQGKRFSIREADFLVSRGNGSINLVGRGGLVGPVKTPMAYPDTMIRVRLHRTIIGAFFTQVWNSSTVRAQIEPATKTTAGIYKINQQDLLWFMVPIPPISEQRCIAAELDRRLSVVQQAEATVETNLKRAERLRQAILKRAFEGRLVPQDPDDEPAAVLLERIRTEKASKQKERRRRHARVE